MECTYLYMYVQYTLFAPRFSCHVAVTFASSSASLYSHPSILGVIKVNDRGHEKCRPFRGNTDTLELAAAPT